MVASENAPELAKYLRVRDLHLGQVIRQITGLGKANFIYGTVACLMHLQLH
jgi:hypothetical protein